MSIQSGFLFVAWLLLSILLCSAVCAQTWNNEKVMLTTAEQEFIKTHPAIVFGTGKNWEPYVIVNPNGKVTGFDSDVLTRINQLTGANFKLVAGDWHEMQKQAEGREIDGLAGGSIHVERKHYLNFSKSHLSLAVALLVAKGNPKNIATREDLDGKTIVYRKGNIFFKNLAQKIPNTTVLEVDTFKQMIRSVVDGKADATFGTGVTIYTATKYQMPFLQIACPLDKIPIVYGVRNDWPEAVSILNKGIDAIPKHEIDQLTNKWSLALYENGFDYARFWKYLGTAGAILLLLGYRYAVISRYNQRLKQSEKCYRDMFLLATDKKKIAEKALDAELEAIQQNLNFVDMISHEYRTPLSAINGCIDILEDTFPSGQHPDIDGVIYKMRISSTRLLNLFESALNEKRINGANIVLLSHSVDFIGDVVEVAADFVRHIYRDHHLVIDDSHWQEVTVEVDPKLMITALTNILSNACKYSDPSEVVLSLDSSPQQIKIMVKDNGGGIAKNELERVVEKYYRSQSTITRPGAGVGLYLTKKIIALHHGTLLIQSRLHQGTEVTICLPLKYSNQEKVANEQKI